MHRTRDVVGSLCRPGSKAQQVFEKLTLYLCDFVSQTKPASLTLLGAGVLMGFAAMSDGSTRMGRAATQPEAPKTQEPLPAITAFPARGPVTGAVRSTPEYCTPIGKLSDICPVSFESRT
jgi:hypothetical protein